MIADQIAETRRRAPQAPPVSDADQARPHPPSTGHGTPIESLPPADAQSMEIGDFSPQFIAPAEPAAKRSAEEPIIVVDADAPASRKRPRHRRPQGE